MDECEEDYFENRSGGERLFPGEAVDLVGENHLRADVLLTNSVL